MSKIVLVFSNMNERFIDLAQNKNALGPPKGYAAAVTRSCKSLMVYPQPNNERLNQVLADFLSVESASVAFANGSTEVFFFLPTMLKRDALVVQPTFWEYTFFNEKSGTRTEDFILSESDGFNLDFAKLEKKLRSDKQTVVYMCYPNNPTSTTFERDKLVKLVEDHKETFFVVDETYLLFRQDYASISLSALAQNTNNLIVVGSLSKIFSLPGVRCGYIVSKPTTIKLFEEARVPYASSSLSKPVVSWLLSQTSYIEKTRTYYETAREHLFTRMNNEFAGKLRCIKPEANFILAKILTQQTSTSIVDKLKERGILVRDGAELSHLSDKWIRFAISKDKQNDRLVRSLKKIL